jgi:GAF domain-containing protein
MPTIQPLISRFQEFWMQPNEVTRSVMREFLDRFKARAAGCWRRDGDELVCLEFVAADDMPIAVQQGFLDIMQRVSLSRVELGCVRAAVERQPVIAREDAAQRGLSGSASWLARFEAGQSLAIPMLRNGEVIGVLAVAMVEQFDESADVWQAMQQMVAAVSA